LIRLPLGRPRAESPDLKLTSSARQVTLATYLTIRGGWIRARAQADRMTGLDPDQLVGWVADRVAPWKRIRAGRLATRIPRTPSGKTLCRLLTADDRDPVGATRR
jgi:acyl-CoA synthetase (AMP-forming)/AMP-acid ligase II